MTLGKTARIAMAVGIYIALTVVLDGLAHWWAMVASALSDPVVLGAWLLFTVGYAWLAWRILRKRS